MNLTQYRKEVIYALIGLSLLVYICARAFFLPITVDEGCTILAQITKDTYEIVTFEKDAYTNNHIFNTLCIKFLFFITGLKTPFLARLPNIIAFVLGFFYGVKFLRVVSNNHFVFTLIGIALIYFNIYYLDFCSLARGYGMNVNFLICSIYFIYKYLINNELKQLCVGLLFAALSVYANFSAEHYYGALVAYLVLYIAFSKQETQKKQALASVFGISILLLCLIYMPLKAIKDSGLLSFFGSNGFYQDTVITLVSSSMQRTPIWSVQNTDILTTGIVYICVAALLMSLFMLFRQPKNVLNNAFLFLFSLLLFTTLSCLVQHHALKVAYMTTRTGLIFLPLFGFCFWGLLYQIHSMLPRFKFLPSLLGFVLAIVCFQSVIQYGNKPYFTEWWFDADTHNVFSVLKQEKARNTSKSLYLGVQPIYQGSFESHRIMQYSDVTQPIVWMEKIPEDHSFEYLYINRDAYDPLKNHYNIIANYNFGERFLLRRKDLK